jgi:hypothetical protein
MSLSYYPAGRGVHASLYKSHTTVLEVFHDVDSTRDVSNLSSHERYGISDWNYPLRLDDPWAGLNRKSGVALRGDTQHTDIQSFWCVLALISDIYT